MLIVQAMAVVNGALRDVDRAKANLELKSLQVSIPHATFNLLNRLVLTRVIKTTGLGQCISRLSTLEEIPFDKELGIRKRARSIVEYWLAKFKLDDEEL